MVVAADGAGDIGARAGTAIRLFTIATFMSGTVTGAAATTEAAIVRPATCLPVIRRIVLLVIPDMAGRHIHLIDRQPRLFPRTLAIAPRLQLFLRTAAIVPTEATGQTEEMQTPDQLREIVRIKHHLNCPQRLGTRAPFRTRRAATNVSRRRILRRLQPHSSRALMRSRDRVEDAHKALAETKVSAAEIVVEEERPVDSDRRREFP